MINLLNIIEQAHFFVLTDMGLVLADRGFAAGVCGSPRPCCSSVVLEPHAGRSFFVVALFKARSRCILLFDGASRKGRVSLPPAYSSTRALEGGMGGGGAGR